MKGIVVPERTEDFTADPVELFFDLAYVFAFSQLVGRLVHDADWAGVGHVTLLFGLLWLPWSQLTWSANAISGNGRPVRALFLLATVASVPMAASISTAFGAGGPVFGISLAVIMLIGLAMLFLALEPGSAERSAANRWAATIIASVSLVVIGGYLEDGARTGAWLAAIAVALYAMAAAGKGRWVIRAGHMAERHALIVIVALGEVIVAIGLPVVAALEEADGLPASTLVALIASGAFGGLLWWGYFDRPAKAVEHHADSLDPIDRGRFVRDVYTWYHAPLVAGIILAAAALEEIALHPEDPVLTHFRVMLAGGLALWVLGVWAAVWRTFRVTPRERVVAVGGLGALVAVSSSWDGVALLVVVNLVILATLVFEHVRVER